jgi:hypothetical protein
VGHGMRDWGSAGFFRSTCKGLRLRDLDPTPPPCHNTPVCSLTHRLARRSGCALCEHVCEAICTPAPAAHEWVGCSRRAVNLLILLELLPGPPSQDLLTHLLSNGAAGFAPSLEFLFSRQLSSRSNPLIFDRVAFAFQVISSSTFPQIPPGSQSIP